MSCNKSNLTKAKCCFSEGWWQIWETLVQSSYLEWARYPKHLGWFFVHLLLLPTAPRPSWKCSVKVMNNPIIQPESQADNPLWNFISKVMCREWFISSSGTKEWVEQILIMESQSQNSLGWERPKGTFSSRDTFHTSCSKVCWDESLWNCLAGISCQGFSQAGRDLKCLSTGCAVQQSQGCCSRQGPTAVVELTATPQRFPAFDGESPQQVIHKWRFTACLLWGVDPVCVCRSVRDADERWSDCANRARRTLKKNKNELNFPLCFSEGIWRAAIYS